MFRTVIDAASALERHAEPNWRFLDCRFVLGDPSAGRSNHAKGHIPGAVYVHLDDDLSGPAVAGQTGRHPLPEPQVFADRLERWGISNGDQVVVYDDMGGAIAARAWWMLKWLGHEAVAVLDGGWPAWVAAGGSVEAGAVEVETLGSFQARPNVNRVADANETALAARDPAWRVMDARNVERYAGEVEPIDPVAGHIPGARTAPFAVNLEQGRLRGVDELRGRFEALLGGVDPSRTVVYCGSGVTACHDLLAMAHAGLAGAKLYPGSWSEWVTDEARPVARGREPG